MLLIQVLILLFLLFAYIFPQFYISELTMSFLPYMIILTAIIFVFNIFGIFSGKSKSILREKTSLRTKFILFDVKVLATIFAGILFILFFTKYTSFYQWLNNIEPELKTWDIQVLYANIKETNNNYSGIIKTIEKYQPDVVMFVEFADHHDKNLKKYLWNNYQYINRTTWSQKFVWSMVFSKYPVRSLSENYKQWMRRYGYFGLHKEWKVYYFYLVHTSSPSSWKYFHMRNDQLDLFTQDFVSHHKEDRKNGNIIAVWDFNISPWSYYYDKFLNWLSGNIKNYTANNVLFLTWNFKYLPIFWSHIDHIFYDGDVQIYNLKTVYINWSDHRWLLFNIH